MTLYTSPDGLPVPQSTDTVAPLEEQFEDLSVATQVGLLRPATVANAAARNAAIPNPTPGQSVWRTDVAWREMYFPTGPVRVAGWYPISGATPLVVCATQPASMQVAASGTANLKFTAADLSRNANYNVSTGLLTITQPGLYAVTGYARMTSAAAGAVRIQIAVNGTPTAMNYVQNIVNTPIANQVLLAAGDTVAVVLDNSNSSAAPVATSNRGATYTYLGPA